CCCLCFLYWTADRRNCGCHFRNCENVYCGADRNAPSWLRMSYGSSRTASPYAVSLDHWGSAPDCQHKEKQSCSCHNTRSEEHTSELQSRFELVCRLLHTKK